MGNVVRMTISVPQDLKVRMDHVKEPVNWSATACQAFQTKLAEFERANMDADMISTVERLRSSKDRRADPQYARGLAAGQAWAKHQAAAIELQRLAQARARFSELDWMLQFVTTAMSGRPLEPNALLVHWLHPEFAGDEREAKQFWTTVLGRDAKTIVQAPSFVHGFADGALSVWHAVKDQL